MSNYIKRLEEDIKEMKTFDEVVDGKIEELVATIEGFNLGDMIKPNDSKQVSAHKNRRLRVINRVIDKFKNEVDKYIATTPVDPVILEEKVEEKIGGTK